MALYSGEIRVDLARLRRGVRKNNGTRHPLRDACWQSGTPRLSGQQRHRALSENQQTFVVLTVPSLYPRMVFVVVYIETTGSTAILRQPVRALKVEG